MSVSRGRLIGVSNGASAKSIRRVAAGVGLVAWVVFVSCTGGSVPTHSREAGSDSGADLPCNGRGQVLEDLVVRQSFDGGPALELVLREATPLPAAVGNNSWLFSLSLDGEQLTGYADAMTVIPFMPDHDHGTPTPVEISEESAGHYRLQPVHLRMAGYWELTVAVESEDLDAHLVFSLCVE